ncbi:acyltransferase [Coxiella endosymbiont of Amblyomma americanum]|nr:acyltransferase [Coxiella endosymbiont of Amblyomma americanum]AUJ59069.1 acyltransferase [Coxiella-like endosymbiont of Amblyomma americanum]
MRYLFNFLLGAVLMLLYTITSFTLGVLALIFGLLAHAIFIKSWHRKFMKIALLFPVLWFIISGKFLTLRNYHWNIVGESHLSSHHWYLLISNHQTWLDILVLGHVFSRKIPVIKFFMKRKLLWELPILGLSCWFLDYPFLYRYSRHEIRNCSELREKNIKIIKKACEKLKVLPTTIVNFVEGTRFTAIKKQHASVPYLHLLKPKSAGVAVVIKELRRELNGILNVTIHYSKSVTLWKYFCGDLSTITVHYELLPITVNLIGDYHKDRNFRLYFQRWLNAVWKRKDLLIDKIHCV